MRRTWQRRVAEIWRSTRERRGSFDIFRRLLKRRVERARNFARR